MSVDDLPGYFRREAACYKLEQLVREEPQRQYRLHRDAQLRRRSRGVA
jgi:hypothetical protein